MYIFGTEKENDIQQSKTAWPL